MLPSLNLERFKEFEYAFLKVAYDPDMEQLVTNNLGPVALKKGNNQKAEWLFRKTLAINKSNKTAQLSAEQLNGSFITRTDNRYLVIVRGEYIVWENTLISQENICIQRISPIYRLKNTREIDIRFILLVSGNSGADASSRSAYSLTFVE